MGISKLVVKSRVSVRARAKEGVALLLKEKFWEFLKEFKKVSSRLMWVKDVSGVWKISDNQCLCTWPREKL